MIATILEGTRGYVMRREFVFLQDRCSTDKSTFAHAVTDGLLFLLREVITIGVNHHHHPHHSRLIEALLSVKHPQDRLQEMEVG